MTSRFCLSEEPVGQDLDGTLIVGRLELNGILPPENHNFLLLSDGNVYELAPFLPEYLADIYYESTPPKPITIFSAGEPGRNLDFKTQLHLSRSLTGERIFGKVLHLDSLTKMGTVPPELKADEYYTWVRNHGTVGQDEFYRYFKKDILGHLGADARFADDIINVVPTAQIRNLLLLPRGDVLDEDIRDDGTFPPRAKYGEWNPIQGARAHYRLVRAMGLRELIEEENKKKQLGYLAIQKELQFLEGGQFRASFLNSRHIYELGLKRARRIYERFLKNDSPVFHRAESDFQITPFLPEPVYYGKFASKLQINSNTTFLPWESAEKLQVKFQSYPLKDLADKCGRESLK